MTRKNDVTTPAVRIKRAHNKAVGAVAPGSTLCFMSSGKLASPPGQIRFPVADHRVKAREVQQWLDENL